MKGYPHFAQSLPTPFLERSRSGVEFFETKRNYGHSRDLKRLLIMKPFLYQKL